MESNPLNSLPPAGVVGPPKSGTPKVLGILNIVFGSALVLGGICCGMNLTMQAALAPMITAQQQQLQQQMKSTQDAERDERLKKLDEQEQAAQTEEEKLTIQSQRQTVLATPPVVMPVMPDMSKMYGMNNPRVMGYSVTDILSGLLLNVFLLISGAGLVGMREWGRKLAVWIAAIKIGRLFLLTIYSIIFVAPVMAKQMTEALQQMLSQMPPGRGGAPPPQMGSELATIYGTMMTVSAAAMLVFGSIYPGILLWALTRPAAKDACRRS